jgi:ABC-type multidrug transport system fused ATPase/permease subunit
MDFPNSIAPNDFKGVIKFENVTFAYPKDKNKKILNNLTIEFNKNCSALVG